MIEQMLFATIGIAEKSSIIVFDDINNCWKKNEKRISRLFQFTPAAQFITAIISGGPFTVV